MTERIKIKYTCPYSECIWPICRRTIEGWKTHPECRIEEHKAREHAISQMDIRPWKKGNEHAD